MLTFVGGMVFSFVNLLFKGLGNVPGTVILAVSAGCAGDSNVRLNDGGGLHFLAFDSASWDLHAPV